MKFILNKITINTRNYLVSVSGVIGWCFRGDPSVGEIGCGPPGIPPGNPPVKPAGNPPGNPAPGRSGG